MCSEDIILEIEGTPLKCKKGDLILNSDYFKAMFEGDFVEKNKHTIPIKDVDLKAMNVILTLLWDNTYYIEDDDVLMVLQAACMLQFSKIRNLCLHKIIEILSPKNCLKIWIITEQLDLKSLYLKAKCLALAEFMVIKESDGILELTLKQLCNYLGNINLRTDNELMVFQTVMKWWYQNSEPYDKLRDMPKLLSCINFRSLSTNHFNEILTYPDIVNTDLEEVLTCCYNIINDISVEPFSEKCTNMAALLSKVNDRKVESYPCILVSSAQVEVPNKKPKLESNEKIVYYDKFKRKRYYEQLDSNKNVSFHILYFDHRYAKFEKLFTIVQKLEGFKLMGYKEFVFMYGGEFLLGRGEWNYNFWAYDSIRERWQRKSTLAFPRRHFESCIIGSQVFITGGTGPYRVNQENVFWYDFIEDRWSKEKSLPVFDRQIKCCNFLNKFFLFSISNNCGYIFDELNNWLKIPIKVESTMEMFDGQFGFSVFSYKSRLYIKGKQLVELKMVHNELLVTSVKNITNIDYEKMETTVCNNVVYTMYKYPVHDICRYSLEKYDLDTSDILFIFKDILADEIIHAENEEFILNPTLKMFACSHYTLVEGNELINNCF